MAFDGDPYRTLGLPRTATLEEVKRAYRRLAKANHPDAAGEGALPRFLAIQAAYDRITGADAGRPGTGGGGGRRGAGAGSAGGAGAGGPRRPWDADPDRADATHRAYGGRTRRPRPGQASGGTSRSRADAGAAGASGGTEASSGGGASTGMGAGDGSATGRAPGARGDAPPGRRGRPPKKATLGSTSYDGVDAEPFEPDWGGASWYGTTSGTYWTLNPKEYADPRKHGPEYQARARRAAADARRAEAREAGAAAAQEMTADAPPAESATEPQAASETAPAPSHTTSSWWDATASGPTGTIDDRPAAPPPRSAASPPGSPAAPPSGGPGGGRPIEAAPAADSPWDASRWLDPGGSSVVVRVARAVAGWAPVALGIGWLAGELTGCGRFAATCDASSAPLAWLTQIAVLALLLLVPRLATAAVIATIATLAAAVPGALILSAMGGAADQGSGRAALGGLLVIGWLVGIAVGLGREVRRVRGPVS